MLRNYQGWSTGLQVQNVGSAPTTAIVTYTRLNGTGYVDRERAIAPGAAAVFYQPSNQQLPDNFMGVATVASGDGAPLLVLANIMNPQSTAAMNYLAGGSGGPTVALPYITRASDGWSTGILVYNPGGAPATARVTYYDAGGTPVAHEEDTVRRRDAQLLSAAGDRPARRFRGHRARAERDRSAARRRGERGI